MFQRILSMPPAIPIVSALHVYPIVTFLGQLFLAMHSRSPTGAEIVVVPFTIWAAIKLSIGARLYCLRGNVVNIAIVWALLAVALCFPPLLIACRLFLAGTPDISPDVIKVAILFLCQGAFCVWTAAALSRSEVQCYYELENSLFQGGFPSLSNEYPKYALSFQSERPKQSTQWSLQDLLLLTTACAVVFASCLPMLKKLNHGEPIQLLVLSIIVLLLLAGFIPILQFHRNAALKKAGAKQTSIFTNKRRFQVLLTAWSWLQPILVVTTTATLVVCVSSTYLMVVIWFIPVVIGWTYLVAFATMQWKWRVLPNSLDIHEAGIIARGIVFIPWKQVRVLQVEPEDEDVIVNLYPSELSQRTEWRQVVMDRKMVDELAEIIYQSG